MAYQLARQGNYPGTDLPVFKVFDAEEYNDITIANPRSIGEVWAIGVQGVSGRWLPTGTRWQLNGSYEESPVLPIGAYAEAARQMIAKYEGK